MNRYFVRFITRSTERRYYVSASSPEEAADACPRRMGRNTTRIIVPLGSSPVVA